MSIAGTRSAQGDEYQLRIALHWAIRLLTDEEVEAIQAESMGLPGEDIRIHVDDVVVCLTGGDRIYIQAKKNQPDHSAWSLRDRTLQEELVKARDQLEGDPNGEVRLYSRSPFGEFQKLVETSRSFPDESTFLALAPDNVNQLLQRVSEIFGRDRATTLQLVQRISFGLTLSFDEWDRQNRHDLARIIPRPEPALDTLERLLASHQANLRDAPFVLRKEDVLSALAKKGLYPAPLYRDVETIEAFRRASAVGRNWIRTVGGRHFERPELTAIVQAVEDHRTLLLTDRPGGGKTCLLLDFADQVEVKANWTLLFIKADLFAEATTEADLVAQGMPDDIVGRCARLAVRRRVVVVVDSLDVLSLHRSHGSLRLFLGMVDRLQTIEGVTIIAACRDFDLRYDPLLRDRAWDRSFTLEPLDFDAQVAPLLTEWGVEPSLLAEELQVLLQVPQHLRVFEKIAPGLRSGPSTTASAYHLYERYLDEVVTGDPLLGQSAMSALAVMAERLVEQRALTVSATTGIGWASKVLGVDSAQVIQRLISQEVLTEPRPGTLSFSHQTLLDCLAVNAALTRGETLLEFIQARPPVPFIRPTVRVFFFYLRAHDPDRFRRQVWAALADEALAYHLRRLVAESFAEIVPTEEDWHLLRRLLRSNPDLFRRLLGRTRGSTWFETLTLRLLPLVEGDVVLRDEWLSQLVWHLRGWLGSHPAEVLAIWHRVLTDAVSNSADRGYQLSWTIVSSLEKLESWSTGGVRELLELLLEENSTHHRHTVGRVLASWVRATDQGDDLLWKFLTSGRDSEPTDAYTDTGDLVGFGRLQFRRHDLPDGFLAERLARSDWLLTEFVEVLVPPDPAGDDAPEVESLTSATPRWRFRSGYLDDTSYRRRRNRGLIMPYDSEHFLLDVLEEALKERARRNDDWWRKHEPILRTQDDLGVRYLLLQAYVTHPEANLAGISEQLSDRDMLADSYLEHEIGELTRAAYPYLSAEMQETHQRLVLSLYDLEDTEEDLREDRARTMYELLQWVPRPFRLAEAQAFLDTWEPRFGPALFQPRISGWGGWVAPPLSVQQLLDLSDEGILTVAKFYNALPGTQTTRNHELEGGRESVQSVFGAAAEVDPMRMLNLYNTLRDSGLHAGYLQAVIGGAANHLRYRFGSLKSMTEWIPREPLASGEVLAMRLLDLLEREEAAWISGLTASHAVEACCDVLLDEESAARLTFVLFRLSRFEDSADHEGDEERTDDKNNRPDRLRNLAINRTRGIAAGAAVHLLNRLLEHERAIPELLVPIIRRFAGDAAAYTRAAVLDCLPYTVYVRPEIGWPLFEAALRGRSDAPGATPPELWKHTERVLYYQYREHYEWVAPFLERLRDEALEVAADTYGRLLTLASLAGHVTTEELFGRLQNASDRAWCGSAQVFCTNVKNRAYAETCRAGLLHMLAQDPPPREAIHHIAHAFGKNEPGSNFTPDVALALLRHETQDQISDSEHERGFRLSGLIEWLSLYAERDPLAVLPVIEALADHLERKSRTHVHPADELVAALAAVLREADELDERELLIRVIALQDRLLRLGIAEVDNLLDAAARS